MQPADLILVKGHSWATAPVIWATGGNVSHVGMVVSTDIVPLIIESTFPRVRTVPLDVMIQGDSRVILLKALNLTREDRIEIVREACKFSATGYSLTKAGLLGFDNLFDTNFFTEHLDFSDNTICCYLAVHAYRTRQKYFGKTNDANIDCNDIENFALSHPQFFQILVLKDTDVQP